MSDEPEDRERPESEQEPESEPATSTPATEPETDLEPKPETEAEPEQTEPTVAPESIAEEGEDYEFAEDEKETFEAAGIDTSFATIAELDTSVQATDWIFPNTKPTGDSTAYGSGVAVWDDLPLGDYRIDVSHPDYLAGSIAALTLDSSGRQPLVRLTPNPREQHDVTVVVEDSDGVPLRDVLVILGDETLHTDTSGTVTFSIPAETYQIALAKTGFLDEQDTITITGPTQLAYTLERSRREGYIYDGDYPAFRRFGTAYYPFDVASGLGDVLGRERVSGKSLTAIASSGVNIYEDGLLGTSGIGLGTVDQNRYLGIPDVPLLDPAAPFTIPLWTYITTTGSWQVLLSIEDPAGDEHLGIGLETDGTLRAFSNARTRNVTSTTQVPTETWVMITLVWDGYKLKGYVNATEAFAAAPSSDPREWLSGASRVTVGTRRLGTSSPISGAVDELSFFDSALSARQISALHDLAATGTAPGYQDPGRTGATVDLVTDVDLSARYDLQVRVEEDLGSTGTYDNTDAVTIRDGIRRNTLDALKGGEGNRYRAQVIGEPHPLAADESTEADFPAEFSPYINEIAIETRGTTDRMYTVYFRTMRGGKVYAIPVYPPERVQSPWLRVRPSPADPVGALNTVDPAQSALRVRHPRTGAVVGVEYEIVEEADIDVPPGSTYIVALGESVTVWSPHKNAGSVRNAGGFRVQSRPDNINVIGLDEIATVWSPHNNYGMVDNSGEFNSQARPGDLGSVQASPFFIDGTVDIIDQLDIQDQSSE